MSSDQPRLSQHGRTASFSSITKEFPLLRTQGATPGGQSSDRLWELMSTYLSADTHSIQRQIANHVEYTLACTRFSIDSSKAYRAAAHSVRDRLIESWNDTNQFFDELDVKRAYYLSLEYLMGRYFQNALLNMDLETSYREALMELGFKLEDLYDCEQDPALGNGGLGRLAACFLDSMASLDLPAWGYGIRYTYGIFRQVINENGEQSEAPDYWLTMGNPWEIERVDVTYPVRYYGRTSTYIDSQGRERTKWEDGEIVVAVAYDNPIPGFDTYNTINLRLWQATPSKEFDLRSFNAGEYMQAVEQRQRADTISAVLYPSDSTYCGKELRLKQQYFFVSATVQDVVRRFKKRPGRQWKDFPNKVAIQLNDTHPSIGIPELMRVLLDDEGLDWDLAWDITQRTFAYTNHTILPEALEKWTTDMMGHVLPRHLQIIYEINWHFLKLVEKRWPGDVEKLRATSIVEEGFQKMIRMANLSIVGSHAVNGVAAIHTELVKSLVFPAFYELWPNKFQNKTNGVTPRRWINQANRGLSSLISRWLDTDEWLLHLDMLSGLRPVADDPTLQREWQEVKHENKARLAAHVKKTMGIEIDTAALFDVQVKRIHEYKRQLMNCLYCIHRYQSLKDMPESKRRDVQPRVTFFGGKAAPGYDMAKRIIKLIHAVAERANNDPDTKDYFKVIFLPNYNVSLAEMIIPAADISQHISTAGMEASGTSNMKFAMNGSLILGTMDGANIEIAAEIDSENMFIFGAEAHEVPQLRHDLRFKAHEKRDECAPFEKVLNALRNGEYGSYDDVRPILDSLRWENDYYLLRHDFVPYIKAQDKVDATFKKQRQWTRMTILSAAGMGKFSTDRTIREYARDIWHLEPCRRPEPAESVEGMGRVRSFPQLDPNSKAFTDASSSEVPKVVGH